MKILTKPRGTLLTLNSHPKQRHLTPVGARSGKYPLQCIHPALIKKFLRKKLDLRYIKYYITACGCEV